MGWDNHFGNFGEDEPRYKVEWHNIEKNEWEIVGELDSLDKAFDCAALKIGASKIHDDVSISEDGVPIWDSTGFKQAKGSKLPKPEDIEK